MPHRLPGLVPAECARRSFQQGRGATVVGFPPDERSEPVYDQSALICDKEIGSGVDGQRPPGPSAGARDRTHQGDQTRRRSHRQLAHEGGLRRTEVSSMTFDHIQQRDARWVLVDLVGKGCH